MAILQTFGGATIRRPGAYAVVDTSSMVPVTLGSMRGLAIIGPLDENAKLAPGRVYAFTSPSQATNQLVQGVTLELMNIAWQHGADLIYVSPVNKATAGKITLKSDTTDVLELTASVYGTSGNSIRVAVTASELSITQGQVSEVYPLASKTPAELAAAINASATKLVTAVSKAASGTLTALAATNLTGGGAGAATNDADWQAAIDLLEDYYFDGALPVSTESAIHAKLDTHIKLLSNVKNRKERRGFYGVAAGSTKEQLLTAAGALGNERATLIGSAPTTTDAAGVKTVHPTYYGAAAVAGIWAGQPYQEPVTYKAVKFTGLERAFRSDEVDELLAGGVCIFEPVRDGGFRIVQGLTTDTSGDLSKSELSVSSLKDVMNSSFREFFEKKYVGQAAVAGIQVTIYNDYVSLLENAIKQGWISGYVADTVTVERVGTSFFLQAEVEPTLPINNFFLTARFTL